MYLECVMNELNLTVHLILVGVRVQPIFIMIKHITLNANTVITKQELINMNNITGKQTKKFYSK